MAEHLSQFALDALATDRGTDDARLHAQGCPDCRARLDALRLEHSQFRASPNRLKILRALDEAAAPPERSGFRWHWLAFPAPIALAAAVALFVLNPPPSGDRLKGNPAITVIDHGGDRVERAKPGEEVALVVAPAGARYVLVVGVEESGEVAPLWPANQPHSGAAPAGTEVPLAPAFRVTPGSTTVVALFSDEPLDSQRAVEALRASAADPSKAPRLPGERGRALTRLVVPEAP